IGTISMRSGSAIHLLGRRGSLFLAPGIATSFGLRKEIRQRTFVLRLEQAPGSLDLLKELVKGLQQVAPVSDGNIAPHFRRTGGDPRGIAETGGAKTMLGGLIGRQHCVGERSRN